MPPKTAKNHKAAKAAPQSPRARKASKSAADLPKVTDTEAEAYAFIREQLRDIGWVVKNPSRHVEGEVWTQNQCLSHPEIKRCLVLKRPENIVRLTETSVWVIEAKRDRSSLQKALTEAEDDYAWPIQNGGQIRVPLISGVAGNDSTGYEIRTKLLVGSRYKLVTINGVEATGFLDRKTIEALLESGKPAIADLVIDEVTFLKAAERINRILHDGGINKNDRAKVMAALLLALLHDTVPSVDSDLPVLIEDINSRTKSVLNKHGKRDFQPFVHIQPPTNAENHVKYKAAIVRTIQELTNLSIKSAMNSGADVLGKFYEVFLKYGNGAKEIGIVLTPRHLTRFAVDVVGVGQNDLVFDPACGTGGFLVAAFDHVRKRLSSTQLDRFKRNSIFGIERESGVAALAIVNMIFRGDGKNNIVEASCFSKFLKRSTTTDGQPTAKYTREPPSHGDEPVTRVFMNPPFALRESDEREYRFIDTTLKSMADDGIMFAIVPLSVMSEAGTVAKWRRDVLLAHHTLLSVVTFPMEVFYPVKNVTVALVLRKGTPHPSDQKVLWAKMADDGFRKSKAKRLPIPGSDRRDMEKISPVLRSFINDPSIKVESVPSLLHACPIDLSDPITELVPEAYLGSKIPDAKTLATMLDEQIRSNISGLVIADLRFRVGGGGESERNIIDGSPERNGASASSVAMPELPEFREIAVGALFDLQPGHYHGLDELDEGSVPLVSCSIMDNGISGLYDIPPEMHYRNALTIAFNGTPLATYLHPYTFGAKDDVAVAVPKSNLEPEVAVFIQAALNAERWRFSYYRKCYRARLERLTIRLPVISGSATLNREFMIAAIRTQPYWWFLAPRLSGWNHVAGEVAPNSQ